MRRRDFLQSAAVSTLLLSTGRAEQLLPQGATFDNEEISSFCRRLRPLGRILELEDYYVWCNSPIRGDDGKIHVFYSRWPKGKGMGGWIRCCEIARATADSPAGPYTTQEVVLSPRGSDHWDATTCHNPHIQKVGEQYCLFYMGNSNSKTNTKRIGLATSDSLEGPWTRPDRPLLQPGEVGSWDDHCTTNPSFIKHANGENWLYYKSWNTADYLHDQPPIRGNRMYGLAVSNQLNGAYTKHPANPLINFSGLGDNRQCEDAYVWLEDGVFKMIARDMGVFNHDVGLYLESQDGVHWSKPKIAFQALSHYVSQPPAPKHLKRYGRLERPQLLMNQGRPTHLFGASQGGAHATSSGFVFELTA